MSLSGFCMDSESLSVCLLSGASAGMTLPSGLVAFHCGIRGRQHRGPRRLGLPAHIPQSPNSAFTNVVFPFDSLRSNPLWPPASSWHEYSLRFTCQRSLGRGVGCKVWILRNSFPDLLCLIWAANGFWCQRVTTVWSAQPSLLNLDGGKSPVSLRKV